MRIALDAMGGDYAPLEVVRGAIKVAAEPGFEHEIVLVGDEPRIREAFDQDGGTSGYGSLFDRLSIRHTTQVVEMQEHPTQAIRKKRDSSLVVCGQMVKNGEASATLSAGNTGAAMAIGALDIGRIPGVERPAIATVLPTTSGTALLLDAGANVDCSPSNLLQFALMGSIYVERVAGVESPTIGLLSIGAEPGKGNELTKAAFELLQASRLNFYGNVEGRDVWEHKTDVVVCDGFAGNVLLKTAEGFAEWMVQQIMAEAKAGSEEDQQAMQRLLGRLFQRIDYSEYGAAPMLGVNGITMIAHGRSKAKAIASSIRQTLIAAGSGYVSAIRDGLASA